MSATPLLLTEESRGMHLAEVNRKTIHFERIPEDELPIDCQFLMSCCAGMAAVYVTSDLNPRRRAVCVPHGNFMMAEWITTL